MGNKRKTDKKPNSSFHFKLSKPHLNRLTALYPLVGEIHYLSSSIQNQELFERVHQRLFAAETVIKSFIRAEKEHNLEFVENQIKLAENAIKSAKYLINLSTARKEKLTALELHNSLEKFFKANSEVISNISRGKEKNFLINIKLFLNALKSMPNPDLAELIVSEKGLSVSLRYKQNVDFSIEAKDFLWFNECKPQKHTTKNETELVFVIPALK